MNEPLMWTSRGNVRVDSLKYEHKWTYDGNNLALHETWHFEDGELARNNVHMLSVPDLPLTLNPPADVTVGLTGAAMGADQAVLS